MPSTCPRTFTIPRQCRQSVSQRLTVSGAVIGEAEGENTLPGLWYGRLTTAGIALAGQSRIIISVQSEYR